MPPRKNKNLTKGSPTSCRYVKYPGVVPLDSRFHAVISQEKVLRPWKSPNEKCSEMSECHTWVSTKQARLMITSKKKEERKNE